MTFVLRTYNHLIGSLDSMSNNFPAQLLGMFQTSDGRERMQYGTIHEVDAVTTMC
jgi:hypothetical protein